MTGPPERVLMRPRWILAAAFFYAVTAIAYFVLPIWSRFGQVFLGTTPFPYDTVLNAGILEWDFRALFSPGLSVFDWTAGFPLTNTLAGAEHLLGWQLFYAPVRAAGLSVAASYNVVWLLTFIISSVGMALFARQLGVPRAGAIVAGFVFAFYPLRVDHAIHLQTMAICWSPFALIGLESTLGGSKRRGPAILAASVIMTVLCGMYFAVFLPVVLALYAILSWSLGRHRFSWSVIGVLATAGAVSILALTPVLIPYLRFAATYGAYDHPIEVLTKFSLPVTGVLRTPRWLAVWQHTPLATFASTTGAFPGIVAAFLLILGLLKSKRGREERRLSILLLALVAISFLLALGPLLTVHSSIAYEPLRWLPMPGRIWLVFTAIRWPTRMILYAALFASVVAGFGFGRVHGIMPRRRVAELAVVLLLWLELRPATWYAKQSLVLADPIMVSDAYPFLAAEKDRGGVVEIPARDSTGYATPLATRYAYGSAGHLRRVTAFHGSFLPPVLDSLRKASFVLPDSTAREFFASHGVTRLVVHKDLYPGDSGDVLVRGFVAQRYQLLFDTKQSAVFSLGR